MTNLSFVDKLSIMYTTLGRRALFLKSFRKTYAGVAIAFCFLTVINVFYHEDSYSGDINSALSYLDQSYEDYQSISEGM